MTRTEENRQLQTHNHRSIEPLGYQDRKGRRVGAQVATWNATMEASAYGRSTLPPGHAFGLNCMATRDRTPYGASQPSQWFATAEAREAAIARYLDGARKRAARNPDFRPL